MLLANMRSLLRAVVLLVFILGFPGHSPGVRPGRGAERILLFHSDITVNSDSSLLVRETIRVLCAGNQIKRGIFRDFPTRYKDLMGHRYTVDFEVLEVLRNGQPEKYRVRDQSNGKRVYVGSEQYFLAPGEYAYTLVYRTNRQLGFFKEHDELYWNVTGNGWAFAIDEAAPTVHLPSGIPRDAIRLDGYTGPQGSKARGFEGAVAEDGTISFRTTVRLRPAEGLTIVVGWPKGFVAEPTPQEKLTYFLRDNRAAAVGLGGFLVLLVYYTLAWAQVGRDPAKGIIMPFYEPPTGFSPAAVRYLAKMGFDSRTFAAAVLNMAVKKYLTLSEDDGVYTLSRADGDKKLLTPEEKLIATRLLDSASSIELKDRNHARIQGALKALERSLEVNLEKIYFLTNSRYLIPGIIGSILVLIVTVLITADVHH